jgi:hypothetical protein
MNAFSAVINSKHLAILDYSCYSIICIKVLLYLFAVDIFHCLFISVYVKDLQHFKGCVCACAVKWKVCVVLQASYNWHCAKNILH